MAELRRSLYDVEEQVVSGGIQARMLKGSNGGREADPNAGMFGSKVRPHLIEV